MNLNFQKNKFLTKQVALNKEEISDCFIIVDLCNGSSPFYGIKNVLLLELISKETKVSFLS